MSTLENIINSIKSKDIKEFIISILIVIVFILGSSCISKIICKIFKVKRKKLKENVIYKNLKTIIIIVGIYSSILFLQLPLSFMNIFNKVIKITLILLFTKLVADMADPKISLLKRFVKDEKKGNSSYKFITKTIRGLIYVIGLFIIISELGYDISGIITGLGLGRSSISISSSRYSKKFICWFCSINR